MEYELQTAQQSGSLLSELREWNNLERLFRENFGEESLKDREFQKMKLKEYNRLSYRYQASPALSRDEKALMKMLHFQRSKIRRALFPGLLTRLYHRLADYLIISFKEQKNTNLRSEDNRKRYTNSTLHTPPEDDGMEKAQPAGQKQRNDSEHRYRYTRNPDRTKNREKRTAHGRSM